MGDANGRWGWWRWWDARLHRPRADTLVEEVVDRRRYARGGGEPRVGREATGRLRGGGEGGGKWSSTVGQEVRRRPAVNSGYTHTRCAATAVRGARAGAREDNEEGAQVVEKGHGLGVGVRHVGIDGRRDRRI
eukprot:4937655-Prymnesium_polylepis.1